MPTINLATDVDDEITELESFEPSRVDGVKAAANGFPILMLKSIDGDTVETETTSDQVLDEIAKVAEADDDRPACKVCGGDGKILANKRDCPPPPKGCGGSGKGPKVGESAKSYADAVKESGVAPSGAPVPIREDCPTCNGSGTLRTGGTCVDCDGSGKDSDAPEDDKLNRVDADAGKITEGAGGRETVDKATVSTADQNDLPDSDFAYIEPGGTKDSDGKTTPRSLRHFPIMDACLVGETLIPLLDGTTVPIESLVGVDEAWVYSFDLDTHAVVAGRATNVRMTEIAPVIMTITLDNDETIECTPNHPFLLRSGEYCRAEDLQNGDSVMPLYRRTDRVRANKSKGIPGKPYEAVFQPFYRFWEKTHQMVDRSAHGPLLDGNIVHHRNENQFDNSPDNLEQMDRSAHASLHAEQNGLEHVERLAEGSRRRWERPGAREAQAEFRRQFNLQMIAEGRLPTKPMRDWCSTRENAEVIYDRYLAGESLTSLAKELDVSVSGVKLGFSRYEMPSRKQLALHNNHKIVDISIREEPTAVYDLTVDGYHNFALASGVFVHNSHVRNALARASQSPFGDKAMPAIKAAAKKFDIDVSDDTQKAAGDGSVFSGANPAMSAAATQVGAASDDSTDDGDVNTPGSPAWEAVDAQTATDAAMALMAAAELIRTFAQRENQEVAAGEGSDIFDAFTASQALCGVSDALGIMAQLAFHEGLEAQKSVGDEVEKAGRRLSGKTVSALATARDKAKDLSTHITGLLGDDDPAKKDGESAKSQKDILDMTEDDLQTLVATTVAQAVVAAKSAENALDKADSKQDVDNTDSVAGGKAANAKAKKKSPKDDDTDLEDEADNGDNDSASSPAAGAAKAEGDDAEKAELTPEEIEAKKAKKEAKKALRAAEEAEKQAASNAATAKAIEEAVAKATEAVDSLKEQLAEAKQATDDRLATVEKMAAPSTIVRTRPQEAVAKSAERDMIDLEIAKLERLAKDTPEIELRRGYTQQAKELRVRLAEVTKN